MSTRVSLVDRLEQDQQELDPEVEAAFVNRGNIVPPNAYKPTSAASNTTAEFNSWLRATWPFLRDCSRRLGVASSVFSWKDSSAVKIR